MKIFGHPIHVMLIHFPSALFPMDLVCYFLYYYTAQSSFAMAACYALAGGVALGWIAVFFGALDLLKISPDKPEVLKKALIHGGINCTVVIAYTVIFYSFFKKYPAMPPAALSVLIIKFCLVIFMIVGNYVGGSLVLRDRVGAEK